MSENKEISVSQYVYDDQQVRHERREKRWFIAWLITFFAFIVSNFGWIYYENQFQDVVTTVHQETSSEGGGNAILNGDNAGAVFYGESKADNNNKSSEKKKP